MWPRSDAGSPPFSPATYTSFAEAPKIDQSGPLAVALSVHVVPLNRKMSPALVVAYTLFAAVPHRAETVLVLGKSTRLQVVPFQRSITPSSPPANASLAPTAHTVSSAATVGVCCRVQVAPFQR